MKIKKVINYLKKTIFPYCTWRLFLILLILGAFSFGGFLIFQEIRKPDTINKELFFNENIKKEVIKSFSEKPIAKIEEGEEKFTIRENTSKGLEIKYANQEENNNEERKELEINFPKDYQKPIEIKLDQERVVTITDNKSKGSIFSSKKISQEIVKISGNTMDPKEKEKKEIVIDPDARFIKYQDKLQRKEIYYALQEDESTGEEKLKNWLIYRKGNGTESESYTFQNAKLRINEQGEAEVRYYSEREVQNEKEIQDVDQSLLERANRFLEKEGQGNLQNNQPIAFIIPRPYYVDKDGNQVDLEWRLDEKNNSLNLDIKVDPKKYPIAVDPTLSFSVPNQNNSNTVIYGDSMYWESGWSFENGDFNADGKTDLAMGGLVENAGKIYIFYNDGFIAPNTRLADVVIESQDGSNRIGFDLAAGDFNSDGKTDLAAGGYAYSGYAGRTYIFYNDGNYPVYENSADVIITGENSSYFGYSLAAGDLNADGKTDLIVGGYGEVINGGKTYIFYNDGAYPSLATNADVAITAQEWPSNFGYSLTTGDFNADGKTDLAVGATLYDSSHTYSNYGRTYIFYNDGSIPTSAGSADVIISGETTYANSYFGWSLNAGDFNADGKTDLAVGAKGYNSDQGRVYVFYNGSITTENASGADAIINGDSSSCFGFSLTSGDFNADGKADLAVGADIYSSNAGRAYVLYNDGSYPTSAGSADVIITGEVSSYLGYDLDAGDLNADGKTDLIIGAPDLGGVSASKTFIFYSQNGQINTNRSITGEDATTNYFGRYFGSGDFNADGKVDLVTSAYTYNSNAGRMYIFYNDGSYPTSAGSADAVIEGESGSQLGRFFTTGDFNSDGKDDIAVGGANYSTNVGRVYIYYQDSGGGFTSGASSSVIISGEASGYFGWSVNMGDFNADGKDDLVVGAYQYSTNVGRAYIFYQNTGGGFTTPLAASSADSIISGESSSNLGVHFAVGDFNADGKDDLAAGTSSYSSSAGRAYIFYQNSAGGFNAALSASSGSDVDVFIEGESSSEFAVRLNTGDFNADGKVDLLIGARSYNSSQGRAYIFYQNSAGGFGASLSASSSANVIFEGESGSSFGQYVVAGDFNADGKDDVLAGAPAYNSNQGRVYLFYNKDSWSTSGTTADLTITGETTSNYFGDRSMAVGDFNADGRQDFVIGSYGYSSNQGKLYFYETRENFAWRMQKQPLQSLAENFAGDKIKILGEPKAAGASYDGVFGFAMSSGDFNLDGKTDLAVSAYYYVAPGGGYSAIGRVYIFYNDGSYPSSASNPDVVINGNSGSYFGRELVSGDFNADGKNDLAVTTGYYSDGSYYTGKVHIFYNNKGNWPNLSSNADAIITGESNPCNSYFGYSLAVGDINSDGKTDLIVGDEIYSNDNYNPNKGRTYVFYNDGSYPSSAADADLKITGNDSGDGFGYKVAAGDLDANGQIDLVASSYRYSTYKGRAYVFYNDGSWPTSANSADAIILGESDNNYFGGSVAIGDLNSDGKDDLAVASSAASSQGRIYIFYNDGSYPSLASSAEVKINGGGGGSRVSGIVDLNDDGKKDLVVDEYNYNSVGRIYIFYNDGSYPSAASGADQTINGTKAGYYLGMALAFGDFNADGKTDLASRISGLSDTRGEIAIFLFNDNVIAGQSSESYFGSSVVSGDFNADGRIDLAVGALGYSSSAGRVYIFYNQGKSSFDVSASNADSIISGETASNLGAYMAVGDFNADGKTDLAVSGNEYNSNINGSDTGRVYIFYQNSSAGFDATLSAASDADVTIDRDTNYTYADFGEPIIASDLNADGKDDLAVGDYANGSSSEGRVYVFYNDGAWPTSAASADVVFVGPSSWTFFSWQISAGDLNSDGKNDLVVSAENVSTTYLFYQNSEGGFTSPVAASSANVTLAIGYYDDTYSTIGDFNADGKNDLLVGLDDTYGRVYLFYQNSGGGFTTNASPNLTYWEDSEYCLGCYLGSAGDFNGDGKTDFAVGAYGYNSNAGRVYVYYNNGSYPSVYSDADKIIEGSSGSYFGKILASGDFNGDGVADLAIGNQNFSSNTGRVSIIISETDAYPTEDTVLKSRGTVKFRGTIKGK